jgi:cytochrome c5
MKSIAIVISLAVAIASFSSCAGSIPNPTEADAGWASHAWTGTSVHNLMTGRKLYVEKCGACHSLSAPAQYSVLEWERIMEKMKIRAGVSEEEKNLMMRYLVTIREVQRAESGR